MCFQPIFTICRFTDFRCIYVKGILAILIIFLTQKVKRQTQAEFSVIMIYDIKGRVFLIKILNSLLNFYYFHTPSSFSVRCKFLLFFPKNKIDRKIATLPTINYIIVHFLLTVCILSNWSLITVPQST